MFFDLFVQLLKYNESASRHLETGGIWLSAHIRNTISWRRHWGENCPEKINSFAQKKKWVFILGCNNSGTTLLHHLLSGHPDISIMPAEGHFLTSVLSVPMTLDVGRLWTEKLDHFRLTETNQRLNGAKLVHDWSNHVVKKNRSVILEKSPPDMVRSRWLQTIFQCSYFIGLTRNGYAVAEGVARRKHVEMARGARHWVKANRVMLEDAGYLRRFKLIKYEDLVEDTRRVLLEILEFIGVEIKRYDFDLKANFRLSNIQKVNSGIRNFNAASIRKIPPDAFKKLSIEIEPMMKELGY